MTAFSPKKAQSSGVSVTLFCMSKFLLSPMYRITKTCIKTVFFRSRGGLLQGFRFILIALGILTILNFAYWSGYQSAMNKTQYLEATRNTRENLDISWNHNHRIHDDISWKNHPKGLNYDKRHLSNQEYLQNDENGLISSKNHFRLKGRPFMKHSAYLKTMDKSTMSVPKEEVLNTVDLESPNPSPFPSSDFKNFIIWQPIRRSTKNREKKIVSEKPQRNSYKMQLLPTVTASADILNLQNHKELQEENRQNTIMHGNRKDQQRNQIENPESRKSSTPLPISAKNENEKNDEQRSKREEQKIQDNIQKEYEKHVQVYQQNLKMEKPKTKQNDINQRILNKNQQNQQRDRNEVDEDNRRRQSESQRNEQRDENNVDQDNRRRQSESQQLRDENNVDQDNHRRQSESQQRDENDVDQDNKRRQPQSESQRNQQKDEKDVDQDNRRGQSESQQRDRNEVDQDNHRRQSESQRNEQRDENNVDQDNRRRQSESQQRDENDVDQDNHRIQSENRRNEHSNENDVDQDNRRRQSDSERNEQRDENDVDQDNHRRQSENQRNEQRDENDVDQDNHRRRSESQQSQQKDENDVDQDNHRRQSDSERNEQRDENDVDQDNHRRRSESQQRDRNEVDQENRRRQSESQERDRNEVDQDNRRRQSESQRNQQKDVNKVDQDNHKGQSESQRNEQRDKNNVDQDNRRRQSESQRRDRNDVDQDNHRRLTENQPAQQRDQNDVDPDNQSESRPTQQKDTNNVKNDNQITVKKTGRLKQMPLISLNDLEENKTSVVVVIFVLTSAQRPDRRQGIRETWWTKCKRPKAACYFVTDGYIEEAFHQELLQEYKTYNDMLFLPTDEGLVFGLRLLFLMEWAQANLKPKFFLRVDDDYFVCIEKLLHELEESRPKQPLVWGSWHCDKPLAVFVDESFMLLTFDLVEFFMSLRYDTLLCHPFGDQQLALWLTSFSVEFKALHDLRLHHHPPASKLPAFENMHDICERYLGLHGTYPKDMRRFWLAANDGPKEITTIPAIYPKYCRYVPYYKWYALKEEFRYRPEYCVKNPRWTDERDLWQGRQNENSTELKQQ